MIQKSLLLAILLAFVTTMTVGPDSLAQKATSAVVSSAPSSIGPTEEKLAPVLPPEQFFGAAAMGYAACKAIPHVCSKLFCYCGCDITDSHWNLLDCFTSMHGVDCHICQEEALLALRMTKEDQPFATIQRIIDEMYAFKYPFKEESPALKRYKASRKYIAAPLSPGQSNKPAQGSQAQSTSSEPCCSNNAKNKGL
ncbi:MAG: hypothetical protein HY711_04250 [Candidatus Melainabacteria bacterium]|nr:hypothetical protein [Candidatus Melainabacteria bacterium]